MPDSNGGVYITWPKMVSMCLSTAIPMLGLVFAGWTSLDSKITQMGDRVILEMRQTMDLHRSRTHAGALSRSEADRLEAQLRDKISMLEDQVKRLSDK